MIVAAEMPRRLTVALAFHVGSLRYESPAADINGHRVYSNVTLYNGGRPGPTTNTRYVTNVRNMCSGIVCGDSYVGAMVACAVRLDQTLQNDQGRIYAWMHMMRNDDDGSAVSAWLNKVASKLAWAFTDVKKITRSPKRARHASKRKIRETASRKEDGAQSVPSHTNTGRCMNLLSSSLLTYS